MHGSPPAKVLKRDDIAAAGLPVRRAQWGDAGAQAASGPRSAPATEPALSSGSDPPDAGVERAIQVCRSLAAALARERAALLEALQPRLVSLALAVAGRIVEREVSSDASVIERVVSSALATVPQAATVTVRVGPDDVAAVTRAIDGTALRMQIIADTDIAPGGCILETDWGDVDALVETRLARLGEVLAPPVVSEAP